MNTDVKKLTDGFSEEESCIIKKAFEFAEKHHKQQKRLSGEPYFIHLYKTAYILKELGMGPKTIVAGLLHDVIEDGWTDENIIKKEFGEEIIFLIEGVTKLGKIKFGGVKRYVESLRKLLIATSEDIRVLIIKLADRLHNMRTLEYIKDDEKRKRIATETIEVYAPIAHRLGMGKLKCELEDLSFKYLFPDEYSAVKKMLEDKHGKNIKSLKEINDVLKKNLEKEKIHIEEMGYRKKHLYSLYKKLQQKEMDIDNVFDVFALRVIVPTIGDCYKVLGIVHSIWKPLLGKIKDYIATPKPNGYKSIHTTIFTGNGDVVEIQVRTMEMHKEAEYGIAAHISYKEKNNEKNSKKDLLWFNKISSLAKKESLNTSTDEIKKEPPKWIKDLAEIQTEIPTSEDFMNTLKNDFFENRIFVFTPNGDVIDLPMNSTPLDFAYHIHSDIGDHASGAKVNNKFVSLDTNLKNGDIVEITVNKNGHPTQKWLSIVKTSTAKRFIRQSLLKNSNSKHS
ncbi:MAG: GTP pyrophosphokinase [Parcubacteria group bacterium Athens0714_16]|nr:MAG: GTP pyrophosphokinase [Parcubacteria group bacterium Athens0714_16]